MNRCRLARVPRGNDADPSAAARGARRLRPPGDRLRWSVPVTAGVRCDRTLVHRDCESDNLAPHREPFAARAGGHVV